MDGEIQMLENLIETVEGTNLRVFEDNLELI